jgi:type II secretory pathway predicted ATPase ExeA
VGNPFEQDPGTGGALDPASNPFRPGMGRIPPDFGGREPALRHAKVVVDRLVRQVAPGFVLYRGVRGVGKTALLAYVRRQAEARGVLTLHLEADRGDGDLTAARESLLRDAAPLLRRAPDEVLDRLGAVQVTRATVSVRKVGTAASTFETLVADLALLAEATGRGVLLTVDEVHEAGDVLLKPLLRAAHRAAQDGRPLGVLLSGLPTAAENLFDEGQTYTERLDRVDLGLLERDGTAEAIRGPFARFDAEVDDLVVDAVHDGSGGYPWFVQLWGEALWDAASRPDVIELPDARQAGAVVHARTEAFFADRWRRVPTGRAALLVRSLADHGGDAEVADVLADLDLTHQAIAPARRSLLDLGLCWSPRRGRLAFTVPGFHSWILRTRPEA